MMRTLIASFLFSLIAAGPGLAEEQEDEDTIYPDDESVPSVKCIRPKMIKATEVIDNRNILFYMRGDKIYRNVLPRRCRNLDRIGAFSYPSTYGRLCNVDRIRLLGSPGGGLSEGVQCRLGRFYPLTIEELEAVKIEAQRIEELGAEDLGIEKE